MTRTRNGCLGGRLRFAPCTGSSFSIPRRRTRTISEATTRTRTCHWRRSSPACAYRYSFDVAAAEGESPYFCVFEADFDDAAALSAARASPEGQAVRADVPNYATGGAVVLNYELRAD